MATTLTPIITGTPGQPPSYNVGMAETFSWIQRAAMDRRMTMKEVAQAVISPDAVPGQ